MFRPNPPQTTEYDEAFVEQFWNARDEQLKQQHSAANTPSPAHHAALEFAREHEIQGGVQLLEASLGAWYPHPDYQTSINTAPMLQALNRLAEIQESLSDSLSPVASFLRGELHRLMRQTDDAITHFHAALQFKSGIRRSGDVLHHLGLAYQKKRRFDDAHAAFNKATKSIVPLWHGSVLVSKGRCYYERGRQEDYSEAITCYLEALKKAEYPFRGRCFHELGLAYFQLSNDEAALPAFENALNDPNYDAPGRTLNAIGNLKFRKGGDFSEAIQAYEKALADPSTQNVVKVKLNLAECLRRAGDYDRAIRIADDVLKNRKGNQRIEWDKAKVVRRLAERREPADESDNELLRPGNRLSWDPDHPVTRIRTAVLGQQTQYHHYATQRRLDLKGKGPDRTNCLSILRGWGSSTPLVDGGNGRGGGYFLNWRDFGIVIDPGFDFVRNFHEHGFHALDVNAILISHNDPDHNSDLRTLEALLYEAKNASNDQSRYVLATDKYTNTRSPNAKYRGSEFTFTIGPNRGDADANAIPGLGSCEGTYFRADHGEPESEMGASAVGFRFSLRTGNGQPFVICYTSDTCYSGELAERIGKCDVLLAHISGTKLAEFSGAPDVPFNSRHLGFRGVSKLIKNLSPRLTLVGEFWAGVGDIRLDLTKALREETGDVNILPTAVGLHLLVPSLEVECSQCHTPVPYTEIAVAASISPFGPLRYLCRYCMVSKPEDAVPVRNFSHY